MSVVRGIFNNGAAAIFDKVVTALDHLLLVPFFLTHWGPALYGEWLTLSVFPMVISFSDLGFGTAVSNSFVLAYASGDKSKASDLRLSGLLVVTGSIVLGLSLCVFVLILGDALNLFEKSVIAANDVKIVASLLMGAVLLRFYREIAVGFFRATNRAALGSFITSGISVVGIVASLITLILGGTVITLAIIQFVCALISNLFFYFIGQSQIDLTGHKGHFKKNDIKMLASKGVGYMISPIWQGLYFQGTTFIVRILLGAESVAVFNTVRTVCSSIKSLFSVVNGSIFPVLQYEYGLGHYAVVRRVFRISVISTAFAGSLGVCVLLLFGQSVYAWWTRHTIEIKPMVWNFFILSVFFNALWWTGAVVYRTVNKPKFLATMTLVSAVVSVSASYLLANAMGLVGAVVGAVVLDVILALTILPNACKLLGMNLKDFITESPSDLKLVKNKVFRILRIR